MVADLIIWLRNVEENDEILSIKVFTSHYFEKKNCVTIFSLFCITQKSDNLLEA